MSKSPRPAQRGTEFLVEISLAPIDTPRGPLVFATVVDVSRWDPVARDSKPT
jgi:hypothetical protein